MFSVVLAAARAIVPRRPVTSRPVTSGPVTSRPVTSGPVTSGPVTSRPVMAWAVTAIAPRFLPAWTIPRAIPTWTLAARAITPRPFAKGAFTTGHGSGGFGGTSLNLRPFFVAGGLDTLFLGLSLGCRRGVYRRDGGIIIGGDTARHGGAPTRQTPHAAPEHGGSDSV